MVGVAVTTSSNEISCQTCEDQLARFIDAELTGAGIPEALKAIDEHLRLCPECAEELSLLRSALTDEEPR